MGSMWLTGTAAIGFNSAGGCWGAAWCGVLMIRVKVVELVMGTVREGTDTAGTSVGDLVEHYSAKSNFEDLQWISLDGSFGKRAA